MLPIATLVLSTRQGFYPIRVEVAATEAARTMGLMHRTSVPAGTGMLFPCDPPRAVNIWMRDVLVPLDIIFLDAAGVVSGVERSAAPGSDRLIPSPGPVAAILELAGGSADAMGLDIGDRVFSRPS